MYIHCGKCGKRYKIDDAKLVKDRTLITCPGCKNTIEVLKPKNVVEAEIPQPETGARSLKSGSISGSIQAAEGSARLADQQSTIEWKIDDEPASKKVIKKGLTVGGKLLFVFLSFILLAGVILASVYMKFVPALMHEQINLRTYSISQSFSAAIQQPLLIKNYLLVNKAAETNAKLPGVAYVSVLNKKGVVVAGIFGKKERFSPDLIQKIMEGGFPNEIATNNRIPTGKEESVSDYSIGGQKIHDVAVMIGDTGGEAHVGLFTEDAEKQVQRTLVPLLVFLVVIALLGAASFWYVARTISAPIRSLTLAAERMSLGEINMPIQVRGGGEIGDLVASLERMRFSIKAAMNRLKRG
jgi:predicted Zn finger-like uncharacterized protein